VSGLPLPYPFRLLPSTALALLCGCEANLSVDLTDGPIDSAEEVVLELTSVKLLTDDYTIVTLDLDDPSPVNLLDYRRGETYRLVSDETIGNGRYVGIALIFAGDGSYVTRDDGGKVTIQTPTVAKFADIDLSIGDSDDERLVLDLNLRFSLTDTATGTYDLAPVVRAVRPGDTGAVSGFVASAFVESDTCRQGRDVTDGVAVYAYSGSNVTPADYVGQSNLIDAADVELDTASGGYRYELHFLPEGSYTLALTCEADADEPASDDAVTFEDSANVTIDAGTTATLHFL
jgi:hypothetical protein